MKRHISKRGSVVEVLMSPIFHTLFALAVVGFVIFMGVTKIAEKTDFEKSFLATDTALTIDTVYAMPETVFLVYDKSTRNITFKFEKNKVIANEKGKVSLESSFIDDKIIDFSSKNFEKIPFKLAFYKQDNFLMVDNKDVFNRNTKACPNIKKESIDSKSFIFNSEQELKPILNSIKSYHASHSYMDILGETYNDKADILIQISLSPNNEFAVYYESASLKSRALGCSIANSILAQKDANDVKFSPVDISYFDAKGDDASIAILLPKNYPENIANVIDLGLKGYFKDE